jgi:HK97 family phage major capsid protein/HK97 family phage prohead protease
MTISHRTAHIQSAFTLKSHQPDGFFCGYASVFQVVDHHREIIAPQAFRSSLQKWHGKGKLPKMLWQHDSKKPVGVWHEIYEDEHGLFVKGQLLLDLEAGREAYSLVKAGIIDSLSIGFKAVKAKRAGKNQSRILEEVDLMEISLVTFGANPEARITAVKEFGGENLPTNWSGVEAGVQPTLYKGHDMTEGNNTSEYAVETGKTDPSLDFEATMAKQMETILQKSSDRLDRLEVALRRPGVMLSETKGDDLETQGFNRFIRKGMDDLSVKALISSSDKEGGYLIPESSLHLIHQHLKILSPIRKLANGTTISNNSFDILLDKVQTAAGWVGETDDRPETKVGDLVKVSIPVHEIYAKPRVSQRLLDDAAINVDAWLAERIAEQMARLENNAFLFGDGVAKPKGILDYPMIEGSGEWGKFECFKANLTGKNTADQLIDAFYSLKADYLPGSCWLMSPKIAAHIRKIQEKSGTYLWQDTFSTETPNTLLGYPVHLCDELDQAKVGTLLFGNIRAAYQIVDRSQMSLLRDPYSAKPYVEFYATKRVGGDVLNFDALKIITLVKD